MPIFCCLPTYLVLLQNMVKYKHFRTCLNLFWLDEVLCNLESSIWSYCKKCCNKRTLEYVWTCFDLLKRWKIWFNFKISLWHSCKSWCKLNTLEHVETCLDLQKMMKFWHFYLVLIQKMVQYKSTFDLLQNKYFVTLLGF